MNNKGIERCYLYPNGDAIFFKTSSYEHLFTNDDRKKKRKYRLSYSDYRYLTSCAITLLKTARNKVIFLTFTFNSKLQINETTANKIWNKFVKNFRKTYKLQDYMGVLELTEAGTPHYHFICDYPFVDIKAINKSWVNAICNYFGNRKFDFVVGSVQLPKEYKSVVKSHERVVKYICKYFTKTINVVYETKNYFVSKNIRSLAKPIELTYEQIIELSSIASVFERKFEHVQIRGYKDSVYDYFNLKIKSYESKSYN